MKETFQNIRDQILGYGKRTMADIDPQEQKRECEAVYLQRMDMEARIRDKKLAQVRMEVKEELDRVLSLFSEGFMKLYEDTDLFYEHREAINLGTGAFIHKNAGILRKSALADVASVAVSRSQITFPVKTDEISENVIFTYSGQEDIAGIFCSMAVEVLFSSEKAEICFADIKGLGSTYRQLQPLTRFPAVTIWNSESQVENGLTELEMWIADTYRSGSAVPVKGHKKYIFIHDLLENVPERYYEQLVRIVSNGNNAGVYVIASCASENDRADRKQTGFLVDMGKNMFPVRIGDHQVDIGRNTWLTMKTTVDQRKLTALAGRMKASIQRNAIIPIGTSLPKVGNWQKKSSENGITIPFGIDENGTQASFTLSSERPYGLLIGDVRVGKSSLLHTILFQILSGYAPDEVRIAIGDFKDGADFNVYAKGRLRSIDAVVNDEDPDAMLSFLKYYVQEMQSRQNCFEQLEEITGVMIQKYEKYREINRNSGYVMPAMPRILLLIDEFQSLFDGASCGGYMTELVRKGATYGIHVILSGQRAVSDNPRNGFSSGLKNYFTSRFVFKTPQDAARTMLADRCADTGRENSGIQKAALLQKGHTIYNSYMGQNEADNAVVQCYYASPEAISLLIRIISAMNGEGDSILLKRNARSLPYPKGQDGVLRIGTSVMLHRDNKTYDMDTILDDTEVSLNENLLKNMILSGADDRVLKSVLSSFIHWMNGKDQKKIHIFGSDGSICDLYGKIPGITFHKTVTEQLEELDRQMSHQTDCESVCEPGKIFHVNVFVEPDQYPEFTQSAGSIRSNPGVEVFKKVLERTVHGDGVTILYCKSYKNLRSSMAYAPDYTPIRITAVGDMENLRYVMSDHANLEKGAFDVPGRNAIKAYYYNKDTEKYGKVILYDISHLYS